MELLHQRLFLLTKSLGHLRHASENPAAQAALTCTLARRLGEARIFGRTHTKTGWTNSLESRRDLAPEEEWEMGGAWRALERLTKHRCIMVMASLFTVH